jgi:hypothetical protein
MPPEHVVIDMMKTSKGLFVRGYTAKTNAPIPGEPPQRESNNDTSTGCFGREMGSIY